MWASYDLLVFPPLSEAVRDTKTKIDYKTEGEKKTQARKVEVQHMFAPYKLPSRNVTAKCKNYHRCELANGNHHPSI